MGERGLEPLNLSVQDPKSCAYANSATRPFTVVLVLSEAVLVLVLEILNPGIENDGENEGRVRKCTRYNVDRKTSSRSSPSWIVSRLQA